MDRKQPKLSIKYDFLHRCWILGFVIVNFVNGLHIAIDSVFKISIHPKAIVLIGMLFMLNLYIRSFKKVYNKRIKILAV